MTLINDFREGTCSLFWLSPLLLKKDYHNLTIIFRGLDFDYQGDTCSLIYVQFDFTCTIIIIPIWQLFFVWFVTQTLLHKPGRRTPSWKKSKKTVKEAKKKKIQNLSTAIVMASNFGLCSNTAFFWPLYLLYLGTLKLDVIYGYMLASVRLWKFKDGGS